MFVQTSEHERPYAIPDGVGGGRVHMRQPQPESRRGAELPGGQPGRRAPFQALLRELLISWTLLSLHSFYIYR